MVHVRRRRGTSQEVEGDVAIPLSYPVSPPFRRWSVLAWGRPVGPSSEPDRRHQNDNDPGDGVVDVLPAPGVLALHV